MKKYLKAQETADLLGISLSKLYKLTHKREIRHKKIFGQLRFSEDVLSEYLEENTIEIATNDELERKAQELEVKNG